MATQSEKNLAKKSYNGYFKKLSTFPFSVTIDGVGYTGFDSTFKITSRKTTATSRAKTTTVVFDRSDKLRFTLIANFYEKYAAYDWTIYIENTGSENSPVISNFKSADIIFAGKDPYLYTNSSADTGLYKPLEMKLLNKKTFTPVDNCGRSTEGAFPYYNLEIGKGGVIIAVGWTGQWAASFENLENNELQFLGGQRDFNTYLKPGEKARSPLTSLLLYKDRNIDRSTNLWRRYFINCHSMKEDGDKLFQPYLSAYTGHFTAEMATTTEKKQMEYLKTYRDKGVLLDWWWMDAYWHDDSGNWVANPTRFPTGFKAVSDLAKTYSMRTYLWFQPELTKYSKTASQPNKEGYSLINPDWIIEGYWWKEQGLSLLDFSNPDCVNDQLQKIINAIEKSGISLYREDFNYRLGIDWDSWNKTNPGRVGMFENLYVQGRYALWNGLKEHFQNLPIDICASGGNRNDLESLKLAVPLHRIDYYGYFAPHSAIKQAMTMSTMMWWPYNGVMTNAMEHYPDKYVLRSSMTPYVAFAFDPTMDIDFDVILDWQEEWKFISQYTYDDYYPLTEWSTAGNKWCAYEYFSEKKGSGYVLIFRRAECVPTQNIKLKGLKSNKKYQIWFEDMGKYGVYTGKQLMEDGINVTLPAAETSDIMYISLAGNKTEKRKLTAIVTASPADPLPALTKFKAYPTFPLPDGMAKRPGLILDSLHKDGTNYKFAIRFNMSLRDTVLQIGDGYIEKNVQNDYLDVLYINGTSLRDILIGKSGSVTIDYDVKNNLFLITLAEGSAAGISLDRTNNVVLKSSLANYEGIKLGKDISYEWTAEEKTWKAS